MPAITLASVEHLRHKNPSDAWEAFDPRGPVPVISHPKLTVATVDLPENLSEQVARCDELLTAATVATAKLAAFEKTNNIYQLVQADEAQLGETLLAGRKPKPSILETARKERATLHADALAKATPAVAMQAALKQMLIDTHEARKVVLGSAMADHLAEADKQIREIVEQLLEPLAAQVIGERRLRHMSGVNRRALPTAAGLPQALMAGWGQCQESYRAAIR